MNCPEFAAWGKCRWWGPAFVPKADKRGLERLWGGGSGVISGVEGGGFMGMMGWLAWGDKQLWFGVAVFPVCDVLLQVGGGPVGASLLANGVCRGRRCWG